LPHSNFKRLQKHIHKTENWKLESQQFGNDIIRLQIK